MDLGTRSKENIVTALKMAVDKLAVKGEYPSITDIHLQPFRQAAKLVIWDDDDQQLAEAVVPEWVDCEFESFYKDVEDLILPMIEELQQQGVFNDLPLYKPYSFVLVDEERETVCELLLVDDDTVILSNELLQGLDEELDDFLKKLLAE